MKFYNKRSENSRSKIVFRTDILPKIVVGAPDSIVKAISFSEFLQEKNYPSETDKLTRYKVAV